MAVLVFSVAFAGMFSTNAAAIEDVSVANGNEGLINFLAEQSDSERGFEPERIWAVYEAGAEASNSSEGLSAENDSSDWLNSPKDEAGSEAYGPGDFDVPAGSQYFNDMPNIQPGNQAMPNSSGMMHDFYSMFFESFFFGIGDMPGGLPANESQNGFHFYENSSYSPAMQIAPEHISPDSPKTEKAYRLALKLDASEPECLGRSFTFDVEVGGQMKPSFALKAGESYEIGSFSAGTSYQLSVADKGFAVELGSLGGIIDKDTELLASVVIEARLPVPPKTPVAPEKPVAFLSPKRKASHVLATGFSILAAALYTLATRFAKEIAARL
ncbi:MAG: hypothetical protein FWG30_11925 [Eubacteriaceae bacterium]|nr:hypothetical protein [Eubacteriaceae bacterium]